MIQKAVRVLPREGVLLRDLSMQRLLLHPSGGRGRVSPLVTQEGRWWGWDDGYGNLEGYPSRAQAAQAVYRGHSEWGDPCIWCGWVAPDHDPDCLRGIHAK